MAMPQAVIDVLNSFSIVTPTNGLLVTPGALLTPVLNTDPQTAFNALMTPQVVATLNLQLVDVAAQLVASRADGTVPGAITLTGGTLGTITGTVTEIDRIAGPITGRITGDILQQILNAAPTVNVQWTIQDASGQPLTPNVQFVNFGTPSAPIFMFLPEFVEFTFGPPALSVRNLFCTISVTVGPDTASRTLPSVAVNVPQVPIPTLVVFTLSPSVVFGGGPPAVLLGVPANSAVTDPSQVVSALTTIIGLLGTIGGIALPGAPPLIGNFATAAGVIGTMLPFLAPGVANFQKANGNGNLFWIWPFGSYSNTIGGALVVGQRGRVVRCYKDSSDFWTGNYVARGGAIDITVGLTGTVSVASFATGMPPTAAPAIGDPSDSLCTTVVAAGLPNFDALMNAYQFL